MARKTVTIAEKVTSKVIWKEEFDAINPKHYKQHPSGIECITVVEHFNFNLGNAIKYIWRQKSITDLEKALWYIEREIVRLNATSVNNIS